jgi:hypothetical protein
VTHYEASRPKAAETSDAITKVVARANEPSTDKWHDYGRIILLGLVIAVAAAELANMTGVPATGYDATHSLIGP